MRIAQLCDYQLGPRFIEMVNCTGGRREKLQFFIAPFEDTSVSGWMQQMQIANSWKCGRGPSTKNARTPEMNRLWCLSSLWVSVNGLSTNVAARFLPQSPLWRKFTATAPLILPIAPSLVLFFTSLWPGIIYLHPDSSQWLWRGRNGSTSMKELVAQVTQYSMMSGGTQYQICVPPTRLLRHFLKKESDSWNN